MKQAAWADTAADLQRHFDTVVIAQWLSRGFDARIGLPHEALDQSGEPMPDARYRAMACARQLYVYARLTGEQAKAHAARLFDALLRYFHDERRHAWVFSVDAQGQVLDAAQDLYSHAFVVLACATYFARSRDARALQHMLSTARLVEERFGDGDGLYHAALCANGTPVKGPEQNPIMHLTEAYQAAALVAEPIWFAQTLRRIAEGVAQRFLDPQTQCIAELPLGTADNRIEPGHQFEWYSLLHSMPQVYEGLNLPAAVPRGCVWARARGVAPDTEGVCAALDMNAGMRDGSQRIWAQAEYARYLALTGDRPALGRQLARFKERFLHARGWREVLGADGALQRADMPSTTPYHLMTAYAALRA
ncbi:AGE family epimerase/isomerase [Bordetella sp. FB-8]|uniref:AGE family epimerase/isomerase n=1 Tax=Bordetella sp. FB-8 TaxID=1159870 RepID=UPI0003647688|nr:AGE family epimerase/isomerase [Bordetella sp. FB-8]